MELIDKQIQELRDFIKVENENGGLGFDFYQEIKRKINALIELRKMHKANQDWFKKVEHH